MVVMIALRLDSFSPIESADLHNNHKEHHVVIRQIKKKEIQPQSNARDESSYCLGYFIYAKLMYYTPCILYSRHKPLAHSVRTNVDFRPSLATLLTRTISEASLNCTYI